jgi:predicted nucleic acid-binding protein
MNLAVDCSFIMSAILPDENQEKIEEIYYNISQNVYKVYVPAIFYLECGNVLVSSLRRNRITEEQYLDYVNLLSLLPINTDKFCSSSESLYTIANLAKKYNLSSYDASYLDVAIRMEALIATLDKNLISSCKILDIKLAL